MDSIFVLTILNVALLAGLLLLQPLARTLTVGLTYALSSLDERLDEGNFARRLAMVSRNQIEALTLWTPMVLIAQHYALTHPHLIWIGTVFLAARITYAVVSLLGIPILRTASWLVGFAAWAYLAALVWAAL